METPSSHTWRLIESGCRDGRSNMALDEALLRRFDPAVSRPIIRLYGWDPPALSLGRFQDAERVLDLGRCRSDGMAVVRRITGGGVIYHADELTYSLVCSPRQIPPCSTIKESFRVLTGFLLAFYRRLGLDASYALEASPGDLRLGMRTDFCFAGRESFDILIRGRKIGGNAQHRGRRFIFQHGSIPLISHVATGISYLAGKPRGCEGEVISLDECIGTIDRDRLRGELVAAFRDSLGVAVEGDVPRGDELSCYNDLTIRRYARDTWNLRGEG